MPSKPLWWPFGDASSSAGGGAKDRSSEVREGLVPRGVRYDTLSVGFSAVDGAPNYCSPTSGYTIERTERSEQQRCEYPNNTVVNSKYTILTFIPLNLWEQFHRPINLYFLLVAMLQFISIIAPVSPLSTLLPLLVAFSLTAMKEGFDDYLRHEADRRDNERTYTVITTHGGPASGAGGPARLPGGGSPFAGGSNSDQSLHAKVQQQAVGGVSNSNTHHTNTTNKPQNAADGYFRHYLTTVKSSDIAVGDLILLRDGETAPCDLVALLSVPGGAADEEDEDDEEGAAPDGTIYVSTENLDGENDAKPKQCALSALHHQYRRAAKAHSRRADSREDNAAAVNAADGSAADDDFLGRGGSNPSGLSMASSAGNAGGDEDDVSPEGLLERRLEEIVEFAVGPKCNGSSGNTSGGHQSGHTAINGAGSGDVPCHIPMLASIALECEGPNAFMKQFNGKVFVESPSSATRKPPTKDSAAGNTSATTSSQLLQAPIPLDISHLILASSVVHNTPFVLGMAVYTGHETRVGMTRRFPPLKWAQLDQLTSSYSKRVFALQFIIVFICSVIGGVENNRAIGKSWYLGFTGSDDAMTTNTSDDANNWVFLFVILPLRFFLLLTVMVPISFKIMVDLSKYYLARTITWDLGLYYDPSADNGGEDESAAVSTSSRSRCRSDSEASGVRNASFGPALGGSSSSLVSNDGAAMSGETGIRAVVNNSALAEDLGQIEYVMTDKTGTLTQNKMFLRFIEVVGDDDSSIHVYQKREGQCPTDATDWGMPIRRSAFAALPANLRGGASCTDGHVASVNHQRMLEVLSLCNGIEAPAPPMGSSVCGSSNVGGLTNPHATYCSSTSVRLRGGGVSIRRGGAVIGGGGGASTKGGLFDQADDITHSIVTAVDWSSPSPDETALVKGAALCGVTVLDRRRKACTVAFGGNLIPAVVVPSAGDGSASPPHGGGQQRITVINAAYATVALPANRLNASNSITYRPGDVVGYDIAALLPFSSDRGRMSVLVRSQATGEYTLHMKGADERVMPLATASPSAVHETFAKRLVSYSNSGLRTLVFASRAVPKEEAAQWLKMHQAATTADGGDAARKRAVSSAYDAIEKGLVLVGLTAVEDKLQDGVPETIALLREAGVRVWMLTGDKTETAKRIALSCRLTMPGDDVVDLTFDAHQVPAGSSHPEHMEAKLAHAEARIREGQGAAAAAGGSLLSSGNNFGREMRPSTMCCLEIASPNGASGSGSDTPLIQGGSSSFGEGPALPFPARAWRGVVDAFTFKRASWVPIAEVLNPMQTLRRYVKGELAGPASAAAKGDGYRSTQATPRAGGAECAGVPPTPAASAWCASKGQSIVVNGAAITVLQQNPALLAAFRPVLLAASTVICCRVTPDQKSLIVRLVKDAGKMTLAIGDGGNDVAMIQEAHVGVGITGYEGKQASKAADFSFGQFRFLSRLMLVHGHMAYQRTAYIVQYSFYKSMIIAFLQVVFNFYTMMSGVSFWNSLALTAYNGVFTVPLTLFYVMDVHAMPKEGLLKAPYLYSISQSGRNLNGFTFLYYVARGMVQAVIAFFATKWLFLDESFMAGNGFTLDMQGSSTPVYGAIVFVQVLTVLCESHSITWLHWLSLSCSFGSYLLVFIVYSQFQGMDFYKQFDFQCHYGVFYLGFFLTVAFIFGLGYAIFYPFVYYYFPSVLQLHRVHAPSNTVGGDASTLLDGGRSAGDYGHMSVDCATVTTRASGDVRCPLISSSAPASHQKPRGEEGGGIHAGAGDVLDPVHGSDFRSFLRSFKPCL